MFSFAACTPSAGGTPAFSSPAVSTAPTSWVGCQTPFPASCVWIRWNQATDGRLKGFLDEEGQSIEISGIRTGNQVDLTVIELGTPFHIPSTIQSDRTLRIRLGSTSPGFFNTYETLIPGGASDLATLSNRSGLATKSVRLGESIVLGGLTLAATEVNLHPSYLLNASVGVRVKYVVTGASPVAYGPRYWALKDSAGKIYPFDHTLTTSDLLDDGEAAVGSTVEGWIIFNQIPDDRTGLLIMGRVGQTTVGWTLS